MTAEKDLMPNIPKLEIVNVPPWNEQKIHATFYVRILL